VSGGKSFTGSSGGSSDISSEGSPSGGLTGGITSTNGGSLSLQTGSKGVSLNGDGVCGGSGAGLASSSGGRNTG